MPDCIIIGGGPSGAVISGILQKRGFATAIVDMRMEIGAPMTCDDLVNINDIRSAGANPDEMPVEALDGVEISCGSASMAMSASGRGSDAFNAAVETDRLKKEITALAALEGSDVHIRSRAEAVSLDSHGDFEVMVRAGSRQELLKSRFLVLAGGSWDSTPAFAGRKPLQNTVRTGFSYGRTVSRAGESKMAHMTFSDGDRCVKIENPVPGGFHDSLCLMPGGPEISVADAAILSGAVAAGQRFLAIPASPVPEFGGAIVAGLQSGLWNPVFSSAFHQSVTTAGLAAECMTGQLEGRIENAVQKYTERFRAELASSLRDEFLLYGELMKAQPHEIEKFIKELAAVDYSEISVAEIERRMRMDIGGLIDLLNEGH